MMNDENIDVINEKGFFEPNKASIVDLYTDENITYESILKNINQYNDFEEIKIGDLKDDILQVKVKYHGVVFNIYLKILKHDGSDLFKINKVLVDDEKIAKANECKNYVKSYVDAKHDFVKAYYAQIKLLANISSQPLLIVDCTQWCIYSDKYIEQCAKYNVDIIDSNLFKVKSDGMGTLYTEGLERFGIKDIEMDGIPTEYQRACSAFISRLARYFIENGQIPNSCKTYTEVFENPFYACLLDIENVLPLLSQRGIINLKKRDSSLNANRLYVSVHMSDNIAEWYENDEKVLEYLLNNNTYYTSQEHFDNEKLLAQLTIIDTISFLKNIDDHNNLMILARNEEISTDWYYFDDIQNDLIHLKTNDAVLSVEIKDIINWNYRGITPLYAYSLEI